MDALHQPNERRNLIGKLIQDGAALNMAKRKHKTKEVAGWCVCAQIHSHVLAVVSRKKAEGRTCCLPSHDVMIWPGASMDGDFTTVHHEKYM